MISDPNHAKYERDDVVAHYASQSELQEPEAYLFERYLSPGMVILDMGVGGGRTTPFLSEVADKYIGADYAQSMVDACSARFPGLEFIQCDAADLSRFESGTFDALVFSFNGIDVLPGDGAREACLSETARVLKPGGVFIFSSHNARLVLSWPDLTDSDPARSVWRILRAVSQAAVLLPKRLFSGAFIRGQGYETDPIHGGMMHYVSIQSTIVPQLSSAGFTLLEARPSKVSKARSAAFSPWIYYACQKTILE